MNQDTNSAVSREVAQRVLEVVDEGLVCGLGDPIPGRMCVEAAVCYAMGLPHGDNPTCVQPAVRDYKINLNDLEWSSNMARARGMRRVAVAQLGSEHIDGGAFATEVIIQVTRQLLPLALRAAASGPWHAEELRAATARCEAVTNLEGVKIAAQGVRAALSSAGPAVLNSVVSGALRYVLDAVLNSANEIPADPRWAAGAAAQAAGYVADAVRSETPGTAHERDAAADNVLALAAEIGVQALIKLGAQGAQWLDLCD